MLTVDWLEVSLAKGLCIPQSEQYRLGSSNAGNGDLAEKVSEEGCATLVRPHPPLVRLVSVIAATSFEDIQPCAARIATSECT